jgi:hypothetical protein
MLLLLSSSAELQQQADPLPVPRQLERWAELQNDCDKQQIAATWHK